MLNKKDIININKLIGSSGRLVNSSSLEFALSSKKTWLYELSHLVRALLVDHVFEDGNKRTALVVILVYFDEHKVIYDRYRILKVIHKIAKENIGNVTNIMRLIKSVIR